MSGQWNVELDNRVDIRVVTRWTWLRLDVLQGTRELRISQRLDHEADKSFLDWNDAVRLKLTQAKTVDEDVIVEFLNHIVHLARHDLDWGG